MRRSLTPLIVLLLLQLMLALALLLRRDPLAGVRSDTPLIPANTVTSADQLVIESKPAAGAAAPTDSPGTTRIALKKKGDGWVLADAYDAPADAPKVSSLLERLAGLKRGLPIATSEAALRRFKVLDSDFERRVVLSANGKTLATVYFGSSPGLRKSDARTAEDRAVYAVDLPTYELPTDTAAWLNADLLRNDARNPAEIDVVGASRDTTVLVRQKGADKQPDTWTAPALKGDQRLDAAHAEALAQQLAQLHPDAVLGTEPKPEWQQQRPTVTLTFKDEKSQTVQWTLSKPDSADFYVLKSSAHPWYFSVSAATAKQMIDGSGREALIVAAKPPAATPGKH
jgi:hypothetical protein